MLYSIRLCYINLGEEAPQFYYSQEILFDAFFSKTYSVAFMSFPINATELLFFDQIDKLARLLNSRDKFFDFIVVRLHKRNYDLLTTRWLKVLETLKHRLIHYTTTMLHFDGLDYRFEKLSESIVPDEISERKDKFIDALCSIELDFIRSQPSVLLPESYDYHYVGPNKKHYKRFLRIGNALQSVDILDSLSFWLIPHCSGKPLLLLDSYTLLPLALHIPRYSFKNGYITGNEWSPEIEYYREYSEVDGKLKDRIRSILEQESSPLPILTIISVKSSGQIFNRLQLMTKEFVESELALNSKTIILYSTDSVQHATVLSKIPDTFQVKKDPCELCNKKNSRKILSTPITISPKTYLLDIFVPIREKIESKNIEESGVIEFFNNYGKARCFSIHKNQHDGKHQMIHFNIESVLENSTFKTKLSVLTQPLKDKVDLILTPNHIGARLFSKKVAEILNVDIVYSDPKDLQSEIRSEDWSKLHKSTNLLIIDDVVKTGNRLLNYKRNMDYSGLDRNKEKIHLLVGLCRTKNEIELQGTIDLVRTASGPTGHDFHCVEKLYLPNWDETECPWCAELKLIEEYKRENDLTGFISKRYIQLSDTINGLHGDLFVPFRNDIPLNVPYKSFWGVADNEVDFFVTVACVIQNLRTSGKLWEQRTPPISKILDHGFYLTRRFWNSIIPSACLRSSRSFDIFDPISEEFTKAVKEIILEDEGHLVSELMMAMILGKIPICIDVNEFLNRYKNVDQSIIEFFKSLLKNE